MREKEMQLQRLLEEGLQQELIKQGFSLDEAKGYLKLSQEARRRQLVVKQAVVPEGYPNFYEALKKWPMLASEILENLSNDVQTIRVEYYSLKQGAGYILIKVSNALKVTIHKG